MVDKYVYDINGYQENEKIVRNAKDKVLIYTQVY